jgi:hypothetical protein
VQEAPLIAGWGGSLPFPLVPRVLAPCSVPPLSAAHGPQPVTRQQLQLVLQVLVQTGTAHFTPAALLLALLLQRADPGLRAAFLNGPEASLLLATLVAWGCHPGEWGNGYPRLLGPPGQQGTWEDGVSLVVECLKGDDGTFTWCTHADSATLVLAQCYLEPAAPRHLEGQQQPALIVPDAPPFVLSTGSAVGEPPQGVSTGCMGDPKHLCTQSLKYCRTSPSCCASASLSSGLNAGLTLPAVCATASCHLWCP